MRTVGSIIRERREQLGMSGAALARALEVTGQAVWNWENQPNRAPSRDLLTRLASVLQLKVGDLLAAEDPMPTQEEQELLSIFRHLSRSERTLVIRMLRGI